MSPEGQNGPLLRTTKLNTFIANLHISSIYLGFANVQPTELHNVLKCRFVKFLPHGTQAQGSAIMSSMLRNFHMKDIKVETHSMQL